MANSTGGTEAYLLRVEIRADSLSSASTVDSALSSILSPRDFIKEKESGRRVCSLSQDTFIKRIEKYVAQRMKRRKGAGGRSSIPELKAGLSPGAGNGLELFGRGNSWLLQGHAKPHNEFRDSHLHENSMRELSKISLLTPS